MFFADYCTTCHDSDKFGADRFGAPIDLNFDTRTGIADAAMQIDRVAAGGPERINRRMPASVSRPTDSERVMLGEWLACGAP